MPAKKHLRKYALEKCLRKNVVRCALGKMPAKNALQNMQNKTQGAPTSFHACFVATDRLLSASISACIFLEDPGISYNSKKIIF